MSPNVGNFVHDLVEMAKAHDRLPGLEQELEQAKKMMEEQGNAIQRLELKLIDRAGQIDELNSNIRKLEVARDDAELRFLEANDRTERAMDFIKAQFGAAGGLIQSLEPPKPEPVKEEPKAEPQTEPHPMFPEPEYYTKAGEVQPEPSKPDPVYPWMGQGEADPTTAAAPSDQSHTSAESIVTQSENVSTSIPTTTTTTAEGQSEPLPTVASPIEGSTVPIQSVQPQVDAGSPQQPEGQSAIPPTSATTSKEGLSGSVKSTVTGSEGVTGEDKPLGRFHGKRYYDHPVWVSLQDWLAEGGTEADYQWRPEARSAGF